MRLLVQERLDELFARQRAARVWARRPKRVDTFDDALAVRIWAKRLAAEVLQADQPSFPLIDMELA